MRCDTTDFYKKDTFWLIIFIAPDYENMRETVAFNEGLIPRASRLVRES